MELPESTSREAPYQPQSSRDNKIFLHVKSQSQKNDVEEGVVSPGRIKRVIDMNVEYEDIADTRHLRRQEGGRDS